MRKSIKPAINVHVVYKYTPIIKEIFFKQIPSQSNDIYLNGKCVATQAVGTELKDALLSKGFKFVKSSKTISAFRSTVFGIAIRGNKVMKGDKIKEIVILIPGVTHEEVTEKTRVLVSGVNSITKSDCRVETWDKLERC